MAVEGVEGCGGGKGGSDDSGGCRGAWGVVLSVGAASRGVGRVGVGKATLDPDSKEAGPGQEAEW